MPPPSSNTMAPARKSRVSGMPAAAMNCAVPPRLASFPSALKMKIRLKSTRPAIHPYRARSVMVTSWRRCGVIAPRRVRRQPQIRPTDCSARTIGSRAGSYCGHPASSADAELRRRSCGCDGVGGGALGERPEPAARELVREQRLQPSPPEERQHDAAEVAVRQLRAGVEVPELLVRSRRVRVVIGVSREPDERVERETRVRVPGVGEAD